MNGTVYIFNAIGQSVTPSVKLTVNNQASSTMKIPGAVKTSYVPYAPPSTQTTRSDPNQGGLFTNGQTNSLDIQYPGGNTQVNVNIPADGDTLNTTNLWLYLFADRVILFNTTGDLLEQDLLDWSPQSQILIEAEFPDEALPDEELCG